MEENEVLKKGFQPKESSPGTAASGPEKHTENSAH
jgi:hypothetical protein